MIGQSQRPYRSHLRPACLQCRRRKSRCQTEENHQGCVTCRAHGSQCSFTDGTTDQTTELVPRKTNPRRGHRTKVARQTKSQAHAASSTPTIIESFASDNIELNNIPQQSSIHRKIQEDHALTREVEPPLSLDTDQDQQHSLHIIGPAVAADCQVLSEYLAGVPIMTKGTRVVCPELERRSRPVLFTKIQKRPVGAPVHQNPAAAKLEIIEKMLEPHLADVIDLYFDKVNKCMPLLDEPSFRLQYSQNKNNISPALLACLYAHTTVYWRQSPVLHKYHRPDSRFIWNLANEAIYAELHLSPGLSAISACILNISGRPTTSLIGNGILLGSAVSMAYSFGLNHSPLSWKIPLSEQMLRMKIWWALLLQDKWTSLANGTPPHISRHQYDVPLPSIEHLCDSTSTTPEIEKAEMYIALLGLSDVLDLQLQQMHCIGKEQQPVVNLSRALASWASLLSGFSRLTIVKGFKPEIPGSANLQLAYLSVQLLSQRVELQTRRQQQEGTLDSSVEDINTNSRATAEQILKLVQKIEANQLGDFWLATTAFTLASAVNFLLRCALETETSLYTLTQNTSFQLAKGLVATLRGYQANFGWDLADVCLDQHADIVDKIMEGLSGGDMQDSTDMILELRDFMLPDASIMEEFLWDPLHLGG